MTVTLDPVHMLKLARNALGTYRVFCSDEGEINYSYIEHLIRYQEDMGLKLGNKVSVEMIGKITPNNEKWVRS